MSICRFLKKKTSKQQHTVPSLDDKKMAGDLKRIYTEMWILVCLSCRAMTAFEMLNVLEEKSDGVFKIPYPVVALYCLENNDCIKEIQHDSQYKLFEITDKGREYLSKLRQCHELFVQKNDILFKTNF